MNTTDGVMKKPPQNLVVPTRERRYSVPPLDPNDEEIEVKPSTELIADEYSHDDNKKALVLIFHSQIKDYIDSTEVLINTFEDLNYEVLDENVTITTTNEEVLNVLRRVSQQNHEDKSSLIIIYLARCREDNRFIADEGSKWASISTKDIWSCFTSDNCPSLKNKPKIFIFQASKFEENTGVDSRNMSSLPPRGAYDIPAEADMMIVYKRTNEEKKFIEDICDNIKKFGRNEDLIGMVTHTDHTDDRRPIIISTLTRKFYLTESKYRGMHLHLLDHHDEIKKGITDIHQKFDLIRRSQSSSEIEQLDRPKTIKSSASVGSSTSTASSKKMKPNHGIEKPKWRY